MAGDESFAVSAELLRRGHDIATMVCSLGERLEKALPEHVQFRVGRFGGKTSLNVELPARRFRLELKRQRTTTWIDHVVRDVVVRSEEVAIDTWFEDLARALEAEAERSTTVRLALEESLS